MKVKILTLYIKYILKHLDPKFELSGSLLIFSLILLAPIVKCASIRCMILLFKKDK